MSPRRKSPSSRHGLIRGLKRPIVLRLLALVLACAGLLFLYSSHIRIILHKIRYAGEPKPPGYEEYYASEAALPQHNLSLAFPEGENGRYLWISNQIWGLGWNNILEELFMIAQMAYLSNRSFVFQPYTWHIRAEPSVEYNGHLIPSRIPLSALISGPIAGGAFPPGDPAPRAVSKEWWESVCPRSRRKHLSTKDISRDLAGADASVVMNKYVSILSNMKESCVELGSPDIHPFDWTHFGSEKIIPAFASLSQSPILTAFDWSPLVLSGVRANAHLLSPSLAADPLPRSVPDLVVIHIRQGDYAEHCQHLANWSSSFQGWSSLPGLPDVFVPPPGGGWGENTPENRAIYMDHCLPGIEHIAKRVWDARRDLEAVEGRGRLKRLYIMTNAKSQWIESLKTRLHEDRIWEDITSSRDLALTPEQRYIAQTVDMAVAERAALFIGNGFSSMTANVVLLRTVHGFPLHTNRFW